MRLLYLTDTRELGGAERNLAALAAGVAAAGHEVSLAAPQRELQRWFEREAPGISVRRALEDRYHDARSRPSRAGALLAELPALLRLMRSAAFAVVHVNNGGFPGSDLCRLAVLAARLAGVPRRVMTVHANPLPRDHSSDRRIQAFADRLVWSSADTVIAPSRAIAEGLCARRGMPCRLSHVVYYGVPQALTDPARTACLRAALAPRGELLVGMVSARPVPEKGYDVFVEALASTSNETRGVLVGPVPEGLAEHARAAGVDERLTLVGPHADLGDYYAAFDVLVVPSTEGECMPLVILEAASVGTPTFGSRLAGIPEAIDDCSGQLFEVGAVAELTALFARAAADREGLAHMGRAAQMRWRDRFGLEAMLAAMLDLYGASTPAAGGSGAR
jgi:glycosyltransferase involved in cell wall biosynthesis